MICLRGECVSDVILTQQPDSPLFKETATTACLHRAVVVGEKDEKVGVVVVDKMDKVNINYVWQSSKVKLLAYIAMPSCGGGMVVVLYRFRALAMKVLIECIDGDLSQPVVIGVITSAANPIPLKLPKESSVTLWRTKSLGENKVHNDNAI